MLDVKPQVACDIANAILNEYDKKVRAMHSMKYLERAKVTGDELKRRMSDIESLTKKLSVLGEKYGVMFYEDQVREMTKGFVDFNKSGKTGKAYEEFKANLENLRSKGPDFASTYELLIYEIENYNEIKIEYDASLMEGEKVITYSQIVSHPYPADKASYPIKWVIIVLSVLTTLVLAIIVIGIIESRQPKTK